MKKNIIMAAVSIVIFVAGFFSGMEYKAYEIRSALSNAFKPNTQANATPDTVMQQVKEEQKQVINKAIGDELIMATGNIKVTKSEEKKVLSSRFGTPKTAKEGTKFVVISLDVTNKTNSNFNFAPDDVFVFVDGQKREYRTYSDSIGAVDNYLNFKELSPSIKQSGVLVYEIPEDSTSYSLVTAKAGTNEVYNIVLK